MQSLEVLRPCKPVDSIATVIASEFLTPTIKSIQLRLDEPTFRFLPGQSVWPKFEREGRKFSKIYSIASSPQHCNQNQPEIELCVSRVGWSSAYLQDLPIGATIPVRGPYGLMTLNRLPDRPQIYLAEGSGIAPLKSHLDWLWENDFRQPIWLIQSNPETPDCLPYWSYWRSHPHHWPSFHYLEAIGLSPERQLAHLKHEWQLDLREWEITICGVGDRVSQIQEQVLALGANLNYVKGEKFYAF